MTIDTSREAVERAAYERGVREAAAVCEDDALAAIERAAYERGVKDAAYQFNDGEQLVNPIAVILAFITQEGR